MLLCNVIFEGSVKLTLLYRAYTTLFPSACALQRDLGPFFNLNSLENWALGHILVGSKKMKTKLFIPAEIFKVSGYIVSERDRFTEDFPGKSLSTIYVSQIHNAEVDPK